MLAEVMLFDSGAIARFGRVEEGTTTSDHDPDEIKHRISVNNSVLPVEWRDCKINLIDTPGYADFVGEVKSALRVADAAIVVICGASGIEVGTEQVWKYIEDVALPRLIVVTATSRPPSRQFGNVSPPMPCRSISPWARSATSRGRLTC